MSTAERGLDVQHAPDALGRFGRFGGRFVPETVMAALDELEAALADGARRSGLRRPSWPRSARDYVGRQTPLYLAERLTAEVGGARIWLKREDLAHTGAHKINNAVGQALLARRLGKRRIVAETGAGQHGVASATVCARFGMECIVYMGEEDTRRQAPNVTRMHLLGATVVPVTSGTATLKEAMNEAIRDWIANVETTHYLIGSAAGPHPYPTLVRELQSVIGREARAQMLAQAGRLPDVVVACVGGGSNAIGTFHAFRDDRRAADRRRGGRRRRRPARRLDRRRARLGAARLALLRALRRVGPGLGEPLDLRRASTTRRRPRARAAGRERPRRVRARERRRGARVVPPPVPEPRASSRRSSRPTRSTPPSGWRASSGRTRDVLVCLSGRGDKDIDTVLGRSGAVKLRTPALAIYLMAGDDLPEQAAAAVEAGATAIEVGIPFSDPLADGPTIQRGGAGRARWPA